MSTTQAPRPSQERRRGLMPRDVVGSGLPIAGATVLLFLISPLIVAGSVSHGAIVNMLPFAAILAIASIGQTFVVQQRGFDLSVPGTLSLTAVIVTKYAHGHDSELPKAIAMALGVALLAGIVSGIGVAWFRISPIVVTLAMNSLLLGFVLKLSGGATTRATPQLSSVALDKTLGVPNTVWCALVVTALTWFIMKRTVLGRRFESIGTSDRAASVVGLGVMRYRIGTYAVASLLYGVAGIVLAAYLQSPGLFVGNTYLFSTVTAVVIAGTSLNGGRANVVAVAIAALFLSQLESLVLSVASGDAWRYIVEGAVIGVGMAVQGLAQARAGRPSRALRRRPPVVEEGTAS